MGKFRSGCSDSGKRCYRGHWRPAEDQKLRQLVEQYGHQNWNFIAELVEGRSGKSCRLRWYNQLDPNINKKPFTEEEEQRLLADHRIYGNKWAFIARRFEGRTDNALKNHYHVIMARRKRERFAIQDHSSDSKLGSLKFQNHEKFGISSSTSLFSLSFSQSTITTASLSFGEFGGGRKGHIGSSTSSWANNGVHGIPDVPRVVRHPFKFSNFAEDYGSECMMKLGRLNDNSATLRNLKMASQQEQGDGSLAHKAVPFIDFLGVGIS